MAKPKFRVGQFVVIRSTAAGMPAIARIDDCEGRVYRCTQLGPIGDLEQFLRRSEIRPLTAREIGPRRKGHSNDR
jgi:hypothetical protein